MRMIPIDFEVCISRLPKKEIEICAEKWVLKMDAKSNTSYIRYHIDCKLTWVYEYL